MDKIECESRTPLVTKRSEITPTLSLAMMVKDEERLLEAALLSARDWVDEMVVVDTGSVDRTVEIAKDCGAKVSFFEWPNDFSKARNETIKRSSGDWVAILDADERYKSQFPHRVRELMVKNERWPYQAILLNVINQKLDGSTTHSFFSPRIFPRHSDLGYFGRIHNCFGSLKYGEAKDFDFVQCKGLEIIHLGYDKEIYVEKQKEARNLTLLEAAVREEPEVDRYRFYLGREYLGVDRFEEAEILLRSVFELEKVDPMCRRETRLALLQCLQNSQKPFETLLNEAILVIDETPQEADAWYLLSLIYNNEGYHSESIEALEQALKYVDNIDVNMQTSRLKGERAKAEAILGQYYASKGPDFNEIAQGWFSESWSHLTPFDDDWNIVIRQILKWSIHSQNINFLKSILLVLAENMYGVHLTQAFIMGIKSLAKLHSNRMASKILKKASNANPNLRIDPVFVQIMNELK